MIQFEFCHFFHSEYLKHLKTFCHLCNKYSFVKTLGMFVPSCFPIFYYHLHAGIDWNILLSDDISHYFQGLFPNNRITVFYIVKFLVKYHLMVSKLASPFLQQRESQMTSASAMLQPL